MIAPEHDFSTLLKELLHTREPVLTTGQKLGLERECLRIQPDGSLAQTPHPYDLGSSLTHPAITTDFSESQIEFTSQTHSRISHLMAELEQLQNFVCTTLQGELLWPLSMPARLPQDEKQIPLARYGSSSLAQKKTIYRRGLGLRYGRRMQTISGIHYNFSIGPALFDFLYQNWQESSPASPDQDSATARQQFQTDLYLRTIRNFLRLTPILPYLFGASPAFDQSFVYGRANQIEALHLQKLGENTWYGPLATSLRMSAIGYTNERQKTIAANYNDLTLFIDSLRQALVTPVAEYSRWSASEGLQLNANLLQIENEHYALVRPKPLLGNARTVLDALEQGGIEYIEIRGLDLNPFTPIAVDSRQLYFVHLLLLHCMFNRSPLLLASETEHLQQQFQQVVVNGHRNNCIQLNGGSLREYGLILCEQLETLAFKLDRELVSDQYQNALHHARILFEHPEETPSARLMAAIMERGEYLDFGIAQAKKHCRYFGQHMLADDIMAEYSRLVTRSHQDQLRIEQMEQAHIA
ncbi:MAG: glutamate--cysteine ligase [Leptospiraceae bacterium]|nr:glutamate--cysteine ligase [Leptospiraceae bacterium]